MKQEIGFKENLEYVNRARSRLLLKIHSGTHGVFKELGRHAKICKELVEHVLFSGCKELVELVPFGHASDDSQKLIFLTI